MIRSKLGKFFVDLFKNGSVLRMHSLSPTKPSDQRITSVCRDKRHDRLEIIEEVLELHIFADQIGEHRLQSPNHPITTGSLSLSTSSQRVEMLRAVVVETIIRRDPTHRRIGLSPAFEI